MAEISSKDDYGKVFLKFYLWFLFLEIVLLGFVIVAFSPVVFYGLCLLRIVGVLALCIRVDDGMSSVGKKHWGLIGSLMILPGGFWIAYSVVGKQLAKHGKWGRNRGLLGLAVGLNAAVIIFAVWLIIGLTIGVREYARDARRLSDMRQLGSMQEQFRAKTGKYFTCGPDSGDCGGQPNSYPSWIGDMETPRDPSKEDGECGKKFIYCGVGNTAINGADFCYYAKMGQGSNRYYLISSDGYRWTDHKPIDMVDCLSSGR